MRGSGQFESEAAQAIHAIAARLENVNPTALMTLELPPVSPAAKAHVAKRLKAGPSNADAAIYAIRLPDAEPGQIHAALAEARDGKVDDRCYSRVLPLLEAATPTLYVGSSRSLQKRLLEHLGHGAKKTYLTPYADMGAGVGTGRDRRSVLSGHHRERPAVRAGRSLGSHVEAAVRQAWIGMTKGI